MKAIKNISGNSLEVDFNFDTYSFPKEQAILVNEDLYAHLQERYPLAFDFDFKGAKTLPKVKRVKTPVRMAVPPSQEGVDMHVIPHQEKRVMFSADNLPENGKTDGDGVEYYGSTEITGVPLT